MPGSPTEGLSTMRVAEVVAAAEAAGATLVTSAPGRLRAVWPSGGVADRYRPVLLRNRSRVLEVLAWPVCDRCGCRARRVVPAYWGEALCSPCCEVAVAEYDRTGRWPHTPWPAVPLPPLPRAPRPRLPPRRPSKATPPSTTRRRRRRPVLTAPPPTDTCPACRPWPWNPAHLCTPHRNAYDRGRKAAAQQGAHTPMTTTAPKHPARYSPAILERIAAALEPVDTYRRVLDPFAGVGGIHVLGDRGHDTYGTELEPEWADQHPRTTRADARNVGALWPAGSFDAVATSPTYGNRMADHHEARDGSYRRTYKHTLGRDLTDGNGGAMQWGDAYRHLHAEVWAAVVPLIRPGGRFVLNCRDHQRANERVRVTAWHVAELVALGLELVTADEVDTLGYRFGANTTVRYPEVVAVFDVPGGEK